MSDTAERYLAAIVALAALGGQTRPQRTVTIAGDLEVGLAEREIGDVIWQMNFYSGFLSAINALNGAAEVFEEWRHA